MKSKLLITSDIYRPLLNKARQSGLTADELRKHCEEAIKSEIIKRQFYSMEME